MPKVKKTIFALEPPEMTILADHPSQSSEDDFLRMESRLAVVLDILRHRQTRCPITIAIYGDWGTGKTSAMHWLESQLDLWNNPENAKKRGDHPRVYSVWFDPWKYHSREEVWRGIIAEVILSLFRVSKLDRHNFCTRITEATKKFGAFLGKSFLHALANTELTLKAEAATIGVNASQEIKFNGEMFRDIYEEYDKANHPEKAHLNHFEDTLKNWVGDFLKKDERIALFIDDLDRCLPEVTLEVLEAIKLYLNIPQVMFVVGVDRDVVDGVVIKHYDAHGLGKNKARQYLDKIFQVEIQIPPSEQLMKEFLDKQVNALDKSTGGYWKQKLTEVHRQALETGIRELARYNPRETKRLLNSALLRGRAAADNPDLCEKHEESLLFAQGVQLFLIQRIIQNWIGNGRDLLREDEALEWFENWSKTACKFVQFKPPITITGADVSKKPEEIARPKTDAEIAYEELKNIRLIGDDLKTVDNLLLLEDILLWKLLRIPFSAEVAQSVPRLEEIRPIPATSLATEMQNPNATEDTVNSIPSTIRARIAKKLDKPVGQLTSIDLREIESLDLVGLELSTMDLSSLSSMPALSQILLSEIKLTDIEVNHLQKLNNITSISLHGARITGALLLQLAKVQKLTFLGLMSCTIADGALNILGNFNLKSLLLDNSNINNTQLEQLSKIKNLHKILRLSLTKNEITDAGLSVLNNFVLLECLYLDGTSVTDAGMIHLVKLKTLKELWLGGTKVSAASVAAFKQNFEKIVVRK